MRVHPLGPLDLLGEVAFPELATAPPRAGALRVEIRLHPAGPARETPSEAAWLGEARVGPERIRVEAFDEGARLWLADELFIEITGLRPEARDLRLEVVPARGLGAGALRHLLLDQVLPRIAFHQGALVLHAGGVDVEGRALIALGATGAGKSSFVAACRASGARILSDDALLIESAPAPARARAWYPSLRLDAAGAGALPGPLTLGEPIRTPQGKRRVLLDEAACSQGARVGWIVTLERGAAGRASVERLSAGAGARALASAALRLLPGDRARAALEFDQICALLAAHAVWRVTLPAGLAGLPAAAKDVLERLQAAGVP